jgi:membrane-associated protease RseP (regulator of RpoE activity)
VELTYLILLILAIFYVPFYIWVRRSPNAAKHGLVKYGPLVMVKTKVGTGLMDRLAVYKRFWKFFGAISVVISLALMAFIVLVIAVGVLNLSTSLTSPGVGIEYALAIPGLNPLLPFWYGLFGLIVAVAIHELAHGMQTRANNMRVDSTGILYGVVPLGAFVEPNEKDIEKSSRRAKIDLYSAGISTNFIAAGAAFFIFAVLMLGGISSSYGDNAAVYQISSGSPAYDSGIPSGAIIVSVGGEEYFYSEDHTPTYSWNPGDLVEVVYRTQDGIQSPAEVRWGLFVEQVSSGSPANKAGLTEKTFILSFHMGTHTDETCTGEIETCGNWVSVYGYSEFISFMQTTKPGDHVLVNCMTADGTETYIKELTLGDNGGVGYVGIVTSTSGMRFITPNIMLDTGRNPIYGADSVTGAASSMLSYIAGPFNGFSPVPESVQWWYDVPMEGIFWILVSILYWVFWLNIMLGVSNAIPAYPFDGGFIFQGGLSALLERLGMKNEKKREEFTTKVTSSLSTIMIFLLILVIAAVVI